MRRALIILAVLTFGLIAWGYLYTGTPPFGRRLKLKDVSVVSIELTNISAPREISASNLCAQVVHTMQKARDGGPVHFCPFLGTLVIHYADGTTNSFVFMPGHRFNRLDMVDGSGSGMYSISWGEMFDTLQRVGLWSRQEH